MQTKSLAKYGVIYMATSVFIQIINLLMVPLYTKTLSQEQFGQLNLLISIQSLLTIFATLGIYSGLNRFINEFENKNRIKNIALTFSVVWGAFLYIVISLSSNMISKLIFNNDPAGAQYIRIIFAGSIILCLVTIYISYYTMQFKASHCTVINLSKVFLLLGLTYYFIVIRKDGVEGALWAQVITYGILFAGLVIYDIRNIRPDYSRHILRKMLKYGLGLLPGQVASWVYSSIDRYFISILFGLKQVAIYSMGYRIGMLMDPIFLSPFKSVFTSFKYRVYKEADGKQKINEVFIYYHFLGWLIVLGLSVFARIAIKILSTGEYDQAFLIVPIIVFSYYLQGMSEFYSLGIHVNNKTGLESLIYIIGAIINIGLNILLIPWLGIYGAALATVITYIIMNLFSFIIGKKYLDLNIGYFRPLRGGILFVILYFVYFNLYKLMGNLILEAILASLLCIIYIIISIRLKYLPKEVLVGILIKGKALLKKKAKDDNDESGNM
jgi:O-antigen/teichoic acid export membrane protein